MSKLDWEQARKEATKHALTECQILILRFYRAYEKQEGYYPMLKEVMYAFGYKQASSVQRHVEALQKKGYMDKKVHGRWFLTKQAKEINETLPPHPQTSHQESLERALHFQAHPQRASGGI